MTRHFSIAVFVAFLGIQFSPAEDWPRWLGTDGAGDWNEEGIVESLSGKARVSWKVPVGLGYSGPSIADGRVFVMDYDLKSGEIQNNPGGRTKIDGSERVRCFDFESGKELWTFGYERPYFLSYAAGPRCTPAVADGKVYSLGAEGDLTCLDAETGKLIWKKDLAKEYQTKSPIWGFSAHPLVHGDTLFCVVGGEGSVAVAFDKNTGAEKWKALSAVEPGYCPPTMINQAGVDQLLIWHSAAINALNPANGEVYWSLALKPSYGMAIMSPRKSGNYLFASGIGRIGALIELDTEKPAAKIVWKAKPKEAVFVANSTPYIKDGHIYGADIDTSNLICARLSDGERVWQSGQAVFEMETAPRGTRHGTAFLTRNTENGFFYLFTERGELVIADLTPAGYSEKSRQSLIEPTNEAFGRPVVWAAPAFAGKSIVVRNDKEMIRVNLGK